MTSSSINGASRSQPVHSASNARSQNAAKADPQDVRAMRDAFAAARGKVEKQPGQADKLPGQSGKKPLGNTSGERFREAAMAEPEQETPTARLKSREEGADSLAGWAGQGAAATPTAALVDAAAPHVDAGAFAQMLADLWTRENGRGSKEVRVRFGDRAWPATGAVLVRNAAGTLDVALQVGDGGDAYGSALPELEDALGSAGIPVGSLRVERDG